MAHWSGDSAEGTVERSTESHCRCLGEYCAHGYRGLLVQFGMQASMSRKGNFYYNAPMESFWGSLKNELVHHHRHATRTEAIAFIREYIEILYNLRRRHSKLEYRTPREVTSKCRRQQLQHKSAVSAVDWTPHTATARSRDCFCNGNGNAIKLPKPPFGRAS